MSTLNAQTKGFCLSVAITSVASALLMAAKELSPGLKAFMKAATVHHWVSHGVFNLIVFVALGLLLTKSNNGQGPAMEDNKLINVTVGGFLLGCALVAGFFLIEG